MYSMYNIHVVQKIKLNYINIINEINKTNLKNSIYDHKKGKKKHQGPKSVAKPLIASLDHHVVSGKVPLAEVQQPMDCPSYKTN